jgi:hypothetical protein
MQRRAPTTVPCWWPTPQTPRRGTIWEMPAPVRGRVEDAAMAAAAALLQLHQWVWLSQHSLLNVHAIWPRSHHGILHCRQPPQPLESPLHRPSSTPDTHLSRRLNSPSTRPLLPRTPGLGKWSDAVEYFGKAASLAPSFAFAAANQALAMFQVRCPRASARRQGGRRRSARMHAAL